MASITFAFQKFFTKYPDYSVEKLQAKLEKLSKQKEFNDQRLKTFDCKCNSFHTPIIVKKLKDGSISLEQLMQEEDEYCEACYTCFAEYSSEEEGFMPCSYKNGHPLFVQYTIEYKQKLIQTLLFCKEKNYSALSNEEFTQTENETYDYSRYLRRSETNFHWSGDDTPQGLLDTIDENEKEMKALQYERKSRILRGLLTE